MRESVEDVARTIWSAGWTARCAGRSATSWSSELARFAEIPDDQRADRSAEHPCQALADFMTVLRGQGRAPAANGWSTSATATTWRNSLMQGGARLGVQRHRDHAAGSSSRRSGPMVRLRGRRCGRRPARSIEVTTDLGRVSRAPTRSTPTSGPRWDRRIRGRRTGKKVFGPYQVNAELMSRRRRRRRVPALLARSPGGRGDRARWRIQSELGDLPAGGEPAARPEGRPASAGTAEHRALLTDRSSGDGILLV